MKTKVKALAAVLPLLAVAQANAAINDDNATHLTQGTGAGELFLSVIDRGGNNPESYTRDLGISASSFRATPSATPTFTADANLTTLIGNQATNGGSLYWNIAAVDNQPTAVDNGFLTTGPSAPTQVIASGNEGAIGNATVFTKMHDYLLSVNTAQGASLTSPDYSINTSDIVGPNSNAYYDGPNWGSKWYGWDNTEAQIGQSMGFYFVHASASDPANTSALTTFGGDWTLASDGTLSYGAAPAPVPLPPAVWLLGSALVGLVGVGRRRGTAV